MVKIIIEDSGVKDKCGLKDGHMWQGMIKLIALINFQPDKWLRANTEYEQIKVIIDCGQKQWILVELHKISVGQILHDKSLFWIETRCGQTSV